MREGWEVKKLKEVCTLVNGRAYKKPELLADGKYPVLRVGNLFTNNQWYYSDLELDEDKYCDSGDLIYAWSASFGPRIWNGEKVIYHYHIWKVLPDFELIHRDFLFHLFEWDKEMIKSAHGTGTTMMHVGKSSMENRTVPIPPLTEQRQIVAILDKAFTAIDQAKANIEKNIENAKELFQSKLNEIFSQKGDGWEEKTLKEVTSKIGSGATPRGGQASYKESGISLIRSMNVHDDGFRDKKLAFIDDEQAGKLDNVTIQEKDVLLNITGASVARCCVVDSKYLPARVNQHVSIIRIKDNILNEQFLHFALTSKTTKDLLLGIGEQGATRQAITKVQIEGFKITFPIDIQEQKELVVSLDYIRTKSEKLQVAYQSKLQALEELKNSLLQKAFVGELTSDEVKVKELINEPLGMVAEGLAEYKKA